MKVVIYIRVSTEDQAKEGYSLEVQREYLESFAKREGLEIFKVYQDDGISGYSTERPALKELLKDAKGKKFDLVLVYKIDRFSRNLKDLLNLVDELSSYGIGFKSATEPFDTTTSAGKLMFQQLGSFAEFERNRIAERVFPGMIKGVQQGNWQGARYAPYGYKYIKERKLLETNEEEAKVVKLIYTMFLCDKSIRSITEYLTRKGYRNRKGNIFTTKLIGDILKNRMYTGKLVWNVHHYDKTQKTKKGYKYIKNPPEKIIIAQGKHQPIISEEDFELAQKKLDERRTERKNKASDYPLSGILYCAKCNHRYLGLTSISNHRTGIKKRWYRCMGPYGSFIRCKNKSVKADEIESEVAEILETLLKNDKLKTSRWMNVTEANFPVFAESAKTDLEKVKNRLDSNLKKQSKLTNAYLENLLSEELYKQKNEALRQEEEELKKLIALQEVRDIERERSKDYLDRVEEFISGYNPNKKEIDSLTKKLMLNLLFKNIKIAHKTIFSFEFFAPFNFLFLEEKQKLQCQTKQRVAKILAQKSLSGLSDAR
ncbi:MAG: recombinase family protein [Candidatus Omnitrophica bacterium]|nr:recombinase family protein [Candidatus Omnitrophota bacterium]